MATLRRKVKLHLWVVVLRRNFKLLWERDRKGLGLFRFFFGSPLFSILASIENPLSK